MNRIELSVIIPTHKRKDYLFFELDHIYNQKDVCFEIIVVNDVDTPDETDEITKQYPDVIYIKDSSIQGPSNKHKAGYKISKGNYLYMPDDDDYLTDDLFFRKAIDLMNDNIKLAFVSGQCLISYEFDDKEKNYFEDDVMNARGYIRNVDYLQEFQHKLDKATSTVSTIFRRKAFDETDAVNMIEMSDSSMYMQSLLWGDALVLDDVVAVYRIKKNSLTTTLSFLFIMNVMRQKEQIYKRSRTLLNNPRDFWYNQFSLTYNF